MIKWLLKYFSKQSSNEIHNKIIFHIDKLNNNIQVDFLFPNSSDGSSQKIGEFLYHLNGGHYTKYILDILLDMSKNKPEYLEYVHEIINTWSMQLPSKSHYSHQPIIKPSLFQSKTLVNK